MRFYCVLVHVPSMSLWLTVITKYWLIFWNVTHNGQTYCCHSIIQTLFHDVKIHFLLFLYFHRRIFRFLLEIWYRVDTIDHSWKFRFFNLKFLKFRLLIQMSENSKLCWVLLDKCHHLTHSKSYKMLKSWNANANTHTHICIESNWLKF